MINNKQYFLISLDIHITIKDLNAKFLLSDFLKEFKKYIKICIYIGFICPMYIYITFSLSLSATLLLNLIEESFNIENS